MISTQASDSPKRHRPRAARISRTLLAGAAALLLCCFSGCGKGEDGPERFDLSGTVMFDGKPVPSGRITFDPDTQKGNSGAQGYADIKDGKFDTRQSGKGPVGGPHVVIIDGYGEPVSVYVEDADEERMIPQPLFREYRTEFDVERSASTAEFEVPKSAEISQASAR